MEPHVVEVQAGKKLTVELIATNPSARERRFTIRFSRPGNIADLETEILLAPGAEQRRALEFTLNPTAPPGRHILPAEVRVDGEQDAVDLFFVVIVPEIPARAKWKFGIPPTGVTMQS